MNLSLFHNEGLGFKDDFEQNIAQMFSAITIAESPPCLTYRLLVTPSGFRDNPGDIVNRGGFQQVPAGETLALIGGNVSVENGGILFAPGGRIELGGLIETGTIDIADDSSLSFPDGVTRGDVFVTDSSWVFVASGGGGSIGVNAKNLTLTNGSVFFGGIGDGFGSVDAQAGDIVINLTEDLFLDSETSINNSNFGTGNAGNIEINARNITFSNGANVVSFNSGEGNLGTINLTATGDITFDGIKGFQISGVNNFVLPGAIGNVGEIDITAQNLTLTNGARVISVSEGMANSGNINLNIADTISIDGVPLDETGDLPREFPSSIFTNVAFTGIGNSGNINIDTQNLSLARTGSIDTRILGQGNAGNITINATESFVLNEGLISTSSAGQGDAGDITINATESFIATNNSLITSNIGSSTGTSARGRVGNISISSRDISFSEASKIEAGAFTGATVTQPGTISLTATERIFFTGNQTRIDGRNEVGSFGDASNVLLSTGNLTLNNQAQITNNNSGEGNSGEIRIDTSNLTLKNGTLIENAIFGKGNAGNITINAGDAVFLAQNSVIASSVEREAVGNGGEVEIDTRNLTLTDGAQIQNAVFGKGNTGNITINAGDTVFLAQNSAIDSSVESFAVGNAGEVRIDTSNLTLTNGSQILSNTFGEGSTGSVIIYATDSISLDGENKDGVISIIGSSIGKKEAVGNAGPVRIDTKNLTLTNGAQIQSGTSGEGNGNTITINATDTISLDGTNKKGVGSAITTSVQPNAIGNAGEVDITSKNLFLTNGAFISSSTLDEGNAGSVTVRVSDSIQLSGVSSNGRGGLFVIALESIGNGGDLNVFTDELIVSNGASISASNFPSIEGLIEPGTGEAGSVRIEANNITLENGRINAATQAGDDGNIILKVTEDIILQDNSLISAEAFQEATGGNIDINANFIIAFPSEADGNDIIASAEQGIGGNINITAEALFGIEEGKATPGNRTNDIDASSEFGLSGEVSIEQPDFDPASGLVELTQEVVDASKLIAQNVCTQTANSEFVDIGKGGLPLNPDDVLAEDTIEVGLVAPVTASSLEIETSKETETVKPRRTRKPPAQGWIWHEDGTVELVAYNPNQIGEQRTWDNHRGCQQ
ncbi:MAG: S-layer family protein [Xenococcaceae cyanobacterium MO_207.B15]|nr:S-layer family protein [Xenococcaceae cyanobacterium MO_207.B15]